MLELGCGAGFYTRALLARGAAHVWAVDLAVEMLRALPRDHVTPVLGDAANVTLGRTFALILAAGIFEFVAPPRVLANAAAHAAPGARLVVLLGADACGTCLADLSCRSRRRRAPLCPERVRRGRADKWLEDRGVARMRAVRHRRALLPASGMKRVLFLVNGLGLGNATRCHAIMQKLGEAGVGCEVATSGSGLW